MKHTTIPTLVYFVFTLAGCFGPLIDGPVDPSPSGPSGPSGPSDPSGPSAPIAGCLVELPAQIERDTTIEAGCTVHVPEDSQVTHGATLFVEAGARLELGPAVRLYVGEDRPGYTCGEPNDCTGGLVARGTPEAPAVFTSASSFPAPGDWGGIVIGDQPVGIVTLEGARIEYAGQGPRDNMGAVYISDITRRAAGRIAIAGTTFEHNAFGAIEATAGTNQAVHGIFDRFEANVLRDNGQYGLRMSANSMPDLDAATIIEDPIFVTGGNAVTATGTWPAFDVPYVFESGLSIYGGATVTLAPGAELLFRDAYGVTVGSGTLIAEGVTFGSRSPVPVPGEWGGLDVNGTLVLSNCRIRHSGPAGNGAILDIGRGANVHMTGTVFEGSLADKNVSSYVDADCIRLMSADPPNVFDLPVVCES